MDAINFLESEEFLRIKRLMGISDKSKVDFTLEIFPDNPYIEINQQGIFYKGRRVILYIRDQVHFGDKINEYKFHLIDCATLKTMRKQNCYRVKKNYTFASIVCKN